MTLVFSLCKILKPIVILSEPQTVPSFPPPFVTKPLLYIQVLVFYDIVKYLFLRYFMIPYF